MSTIVNTIEQTTSSIREAVTFDRGHINGRLVHLNGDPATHQKVKVIFPLLCFKITAGTAETDKDGNFSINLNRTFSWLRDPDKVILQVVEETLERKGFLFFSGNGERVIDKVAINTGGSGGSRNLGNVPIELYEYQKDLPMLKQPGDSGQRPQQASTAYMIDLALANLDEKIKESLHGLDILNSSVEDIHNCYGVYNPELRVTPENTIDMLLNGIFPAYFLKGSHEGEVTVPINWKDYDKDLSPLLLNTTLGIDLGVNQKGTELNIKYVDVQDKDGTWHHIEKSDSRFDRALYLFNSMALVKGEIVSHLGLGHLITEECSMAVFRAVNKNPLGDLLKPHLREVQEIDRLGATAIFGPEGILNVSGLTVDGIREALKDVVSGVCYSNFKPRKMVNDDHVMAKGGQIYWDIVSGVVDRFFGENIENIKKSWYEVFYLSKNLVEHSRPYQAWEGVENHTSWIDPNEVDNPAFGERVFFDGAYRAMRPITTSKECPKEGDIERLKQFCRFSIFNSTWWHFTVHNTQGKWGTNMKFASLAPDAPSDDILKDEEYGGTTVDNAIKQFTIAHILMNFERGNLIDNPNGDVYPPLIAKLEENRAAFTALGYDIGEYPYGVLI
ncbi:MAG: hypothetical protein ACI9S8_001498 [Chlamydiales bacterium]|jgi:hypothetical protein